MNSLLKYLLTIIIFGLAISFILTSCDTNRVYEENTDISGTEWSYDDTIHFNVYIADTFPKNIYIITRHGFYFDWRNMWTKVYIQTPKDSVLEVDVNIPLSEPNGKWYGKCTGDICMMYFPLKNFIHYTFPDTGKYRFSLVQNMRENPLSNIYSMGIRVENATKNKTKN